VPRKLPVEVFDKNIKAIRVLPALPPLCSGEAGFLNIIYPVTLLGDIIENGKGIPVASGPLLLLASSSGCCLRLFFIYLTIYL
jgi:hypothetical protein